MEAVIGSYKISRRTAYSKIQITNVNTGDVIPVTSKALETLINDFVEQTENPDKYFVINGNVVEGLNQDFFEECPKNLFIPEGITEIAQSAFRYTDIKLVSFPSTLKKIGDNAFSGSVCLTEINIPDSVTEIGLFAFQDAKALTNVKLSNRLERLSQGVFSCCESLKEIAIPDSVLEIGPSAFSTCTALNDITLSKNLIKIGNCAFSTCFALKNITLPDSLKEIGNASFEYCGLEGIIIPNSVEIISREAFKECENLESVVLSENLKSIESSLFSGCRSLQNLRLPNSVERIESYAFSEVEIRSVNIPKNLKEINDQVFGNSGVNRVFFNYDLPSLNVYKPEFNDLAFGAPINKLIIDSSVKVITPDTFKKWGEQIRYIDYNGSKEDFKEFKKNNKELFDVLPNAKVSYIKQEIRKEIDDIAR